MEVAKVTAPTPFDFAVLDTKSEADAGTIVHIEDPRTGDPLYGPDDEPVTITILGEDSAKVREFDRKATDRQYERARRRGTFDIDATAVESQKFSRLAAATVAWQGIRLDGAALECSEQNAKRLYADPRFPWLMEQLYRAMQDRLRFFSKA